MSINANSNPRAYPTFPRIMVAWVFCVLFLAFVTYFGGDDPAATWVTIVILVVGLIAAPAIAKDERN
jgi:hypothetical protein